MSRTYYTKIRIENANFTTKRISEKELTLKELPI